MTVATDLWWWGSTEWAAYCDAYGGGVVSNFGPNGNLVIVLDDAMWTRIRKGHQAAIRKAERELTIAESFDDYQMVHRLANGSVRPAATFKLQQGWIGRCAFALVAYIRGVPAAAGYFVWQGEGSYYFSGPRNPNIDAQGAAHLIVWTAMKKLRDMGVRWLDCGPLPDDDPKHISVAAFKRHFGATVKVWPNYV